VDKLSTRISILSILVAAAFKDFSILEILAPSEPVFIVGGFEVDGGGNGGLDVAQPINTKNKDKTASLLIITFDQAVPALFEFVLIADL